MQDDGATDSSAIRRILLKKEAVRLAVIIEDDLFRTAPLEMLFQDLSQFVTQKPAPGNLLEIFPAAEFISSCYQFRDGELAPLGTIHILSRPCKSAEWLIGKPHILFPAMHPVIAIFLKPCEPDLQNLRTIRHLCQPQTGKGTAITRQYPFIRLLLQLLQFAAQDGKPPIRKWN